MEECQSARIFIVVGFIYCDIFEKENCALKEIRKGQRLNQGRMSSAEECNFFHLECIVKEMKGKTKVTETESLSKERKGEFGAMLKAEKLTEMMESIAVQY